MPQLLDHRLSLIIRGAADVIHKQFVREHARIVVIQTEYPLDIDIAQVTVCSLLRDRFYLHFRRLLPVVDRLLSSGRRAQSTQETL